MTVKWWTDFDMVLAHFSIKWERQVLVTLVNGAKERKTARHVPLTHLLKDRIFRRSTLDPHIHALQLVQLTVTPRTDLYVPAKLNLVEYFDL